MKEEYILKARYGYVHKLKQVEGNKYVLVPQEEWMHYQISFDPNPDGSKTIYSIDPDGGPYMYVGWSNDEVEVTALYEDKERNDIILELKAVKK